MVLLIYLVCFLANVLLIQCDYNITVQVVMTNEACHVKAIHEIPRGERINIYYENNNIEPSTHKPYTLDYIRFSGECKLDDKDSAKIVSRTGIIQSNYKPSQNITNCRIQFLYLRNTENNIAKITYKDNRYANSSCETNIYIIDGVIPTDTTTPANYTNNLISTQKQDGSGQEPGNKWWYIGGGVAALVAVTLIGQTAGIMYFKAKAAKLNKDKNGNRNNSAAKLDRVRNLSERHNSNANDTGRYSTMPGQKGIKIPPLGKDREQERESTIYETVNIHMAGMPPVPPAISTLPRLPRNKHPADTQTHLAPPTPAVALRGMAPLPSPMMRSRDRELPGLLPATPISQRLPIPIPTEEATYEDMIFEPEDTYEPPPIPEAQRLPARTPAKNVRNPIPVPPKPVDRRAIPDFTAQKPKPAPKTKISAPVLEPVTSELDSILKKRRNVLQVPVPAASGRNGPLTRPMIPIPTQSIPDTTKSNGPLIKPKPPPPVKPMKPPPMEEPEPCFEEDYESSDEEWTYEPLKPIDPHIYQI